MVGIGEIVALAKGLGGSGGGSSGGGVLVVTDTDGTLDKTWKEIKDAWDAGKVVCRGGFGDTDGIYYMSLLDADAEGYWVSFNGGAYTYLAPTQTDYPVLQSE